jgi:hypothetical protein
VKFEREGKEPLHGFMRVDRGMVIVSGYGRHKRAARQARAILAVVLAAGALLSTALCLGMFFGR